jgi:uncharacterized protein with HEPN domain
MFDINNVDRQVEMFVFDIYIAILKIEDTASNFDNVQDLLYNYNSWDSVIREFEIIGEATKYLIRDNLLDNSYRKIIDFRNIITHEYFGIEPDEIWDVIYNNLDEIKSMVIQLINHIEPQLKIELIDAFIQDNHYLLFVIDKLKEIR